jgi:ketosteroid isomerase-like protein
MAQKNQQIIDEFFEAYKKRDMKAIRKVMAENVTWHFLGLNPVAGVKNGIEEVIEFFDTMAKIMEKSRPEMEKLIMAENDRYFIECQRSKTHREDGNNLENYHTVLWTIEDGKIIEGRHFFADPQGVDKYFSAVAPRANSIL